MLTIQTLFVLLIILLLGYLLVDGSISRAVWVKGARNGLFSFRSWAHKRGRDDEPWIYWCAMGFYAVAIICLCGLLLFG